MDGNDTARLRYHGTGGALLGLVAVNAVLTLLTVGIYSFWARNRLRRFHYRNTELDGDRFEYHGTGGELLCGALKGAGILLVLVVAYVLASAATGGELAPLSVQVAVSAWFYLVILGLMPIAITGARRYRMSRSAWRGIRFSFDGRPQDYLVLTIKGVILSVLTLGFYRPYHQNLRRAFLVNHTRYGSERFFYDADGRELFWEYVKALLLTLPTIGLWWIWYAAFRHRYFWKHTVVSDARFHATVTGGNLFLLHVTNALLTLCTLGIGAPWAMARTHAFWCDNIVLQGTIDWVGIEERSHAADATAEGLADALDIDVGLVG